MKKEVEATVAFTLCSNNYLAHAKTLGDSFLKFHPNVTFVIGLVDRYSSEFDYSYFAKFIIVPVEELEINGFEELNRKYKIAELNTSVKPDYIHYLFKRFKCDNVIYIDPDILVCSPFSEVFSILKEKNIIITPHICSPIDDEFAPTDYHTLRGGVFNLGFIALSNYDKIFTFLNWWQERVKKYGFSNFSENMFYDQLWINYVPAFYDNFYILKHLGYNMANWNLHERILTGTEDFEYIVNSKYQLRFFHFSSYSYDNPGVICGYLTRFNFESRPDLVILFRQYQNLLSANMIEKIKNLDVYFYPNLKNAVQTTANKNIITRGLRRIKRALKVLISG